jgi:hypothetical protein
LFGVQIAQVLVTLVAAAVLIFSALCLLALVMQQLGDNASSLRALKLERMPVRVAAPRARIRRRAGSLASLPTRAPPADLQQRRAIPPGLADGE